MSFLSYGWSCIAINLAAMMMNGAEEVMVSCLIVVLVITIPTFFFIEETPEYLLQKGEISKLVAGICRLGRFNLRKLRKHELYSLLVDKPKHVEEIVKA